MPKPDVLTPCPHCGKTEWVFVDDKDGHLFCWRNLGKDKRGCGWAWFPGHEQDDVAGVTRVQAPPTQVTLSNPPLPPASLPSGLTFHDVEQALFRALIEGLQGPAIEIKMKAMTEAVELLKGRTSR